MVYVHLSLTTVQLCPHPVELIRTRGIDQSAPNKVCIHPFYLNCLQKDSVLLGLYPNLCCESHYRILLKIITLHNTHLPLRWFSVSRVGSKRACFASVEDDEGISCHQGELRPSYSYVNYTHVGRVLAHVHMVRP